MAAPLCQARREEVSGIIKKYRNDKHFMSLWSLVHTGEVVGKQFCYHEIPERLDPYDYEAFF